MLLKELESVKREKEKMCDKYAEMAMALKDVTEELRQAKDEKELAKDKSKTYERH